MGRWGGSGSGSGSRGGGRPAGSGSGSGGLGEVLGSREIPIGDNPGVGLGGVPGLRQIRAIDRDAFCSHPHVPRPVPGHLVGDACFALVEHGPVHRDGGLSAVVDDPAVPDGLRHPAAAQVQVHPKLGQDGRLALVDVHSHRIVLHRRHRARCENGDSRIRVDSSPAPDNDPAATREIDAHPLAGHPPVHRDGLPAVAFFLVHSGYALRYSFVVDDPYPDALRIPDVDRALGRDPDVDRALGRDRDGPGVRSTKMIGHDAVGIFARRGNGVAVSSIDGDVALALMKTIDAVGIRAPGRDGAAPDVDGEVVLALMKTKDAVGIRAPGRDGAAPDVDGEVVLALMKTKDAVGIRAPGRDGAAPDVDGEVALALMMTKDAVGMRAPGRDGAAPDVDGEVALALMKTKDAVGMRAPILIDFRALRRDGGV